MAKSIHSPAYTSMLRLLRQLRLDAGLRQVDLAERLGRLQTFVSKYEVGERRLDVIELRTICQHLGTDLPAFAILLEAELTTLDRGPGITGRRGRTTQLPAQQSRPGASPSVVPRRRTPTDKDD